uniref:Uncharacterized protein n=1 Tax=Chromera velia CCMP2878 TaxID=1169474 RepID=A0A0G4HR99_9ALVE|eukprot:Cvel_30472.t1-p1 / transcript=Cvel_30472.t1 / gene=Cvel_30472 / organism=Chromera_velia_CCMP2878 / gene_product=hypothetical protein / transcript_product=hypothetical protein / location=Cvel_scaffold4350:6766-8233(+) / protein_length=66 / sequence_SO=supercontig / SO=protein_coding / is_pseudo=false
MLKTCRNNQKHGALSGFVGQGETSQEKLAIPLTRSRGGQSRTWNQDRPLTVGAQVRSLCCCGCGGL